MLNTSFSPWPQFTEEEIDAVRNVLLTNRVNYWTGAQTRDFEKEFADYHGSKHAIAVANGTLALELALHALGIEAGDEVVVTPRTFIASVSCVVSCGGTPVFADVDRDSQNISAKTIAPVITAATKAIIVVHLAGQPADMDEIMTLANKHDIKVIEDCAQAHGAQYKGRHVGTIGHIGAWSFCQDKIMTTGGEGGMVTTQDSDLWSLMWSYKDHGKSHDAVFNKSHPVGFRWLHESFGSNYRMLEMQAAIGRIQLKRLPLWQKQRRQNAEIIWEACRSMSWLRVPEIQPYVEHAAYRAYAFVDQSKLPEGWDRDRIMAEIGSVGVPVFSGSCSEVYLEKAFNDTGWVPKEPLPVAHELGECSLMFLVHPTLTSQEIEKTVAAVSHVDQLMYSVV